MAQEKVVVTGGLGFIGSHLVEALVAQGYEVHSIDNGAGGVRDDRKIAGAVYHDVDLTNVLELATVFEGAQYVFHEAALPRVQFSIEYPLETFEVNADGTIAVLKAAKDAGVKRVMYAASSSAYGNQETLPLTETLPAQPLSPYGLQKYIGELACRVWSEVYGLETVSLRYFNVYGPRLDPNGAYALVIGKFLKQRKNNEPMTITGDGEQTRDFTHVRDIVQANILAMKSSNVGKGEVINIGAGRNVSINELTKMIGGPTAYVPPRLEPKHTRADNAKAKELLGWQPTITLEDGIAELKKEFGIA